MTKKNPKIWRYKVSEGQQPYIKTTALLILSTFTLSQHEGNPYCHVPCYGYLFGPKGVNIGKVGCYVYGENRENEMPSEN